MQYEKVKELLQEQQIWGQIQLQPWLGTWLILTSKDKVGKKHQDKGLLLFLPTAHLVLPRVNLSLSSWTLQSYTCRSRRKDCASVILREHQGFSTWWTTAEGSQSEIVIWRAQRYILKNWNHTLLSITGLQIILNHLEVMRMNNDAKGLTQKWIPYFVPSFFTL